MLRQSEAVDFLVNLVASGDEKAALASLWVLKIHAHDPRIKERIAEVIEERNFRHSTGGPSAIFDHADRRNGCIFQYVRLRHTHSSGPKRKYRSQIGLTASCKSQMPPTTK